jgi:hypothetical protein
MNCFAMSNEEDGQHGTVINSDSELSHRDDDGLVVESEKSNGGG